MKRKTILVFAWLLGVAAIFAWTAVSYSAQKNPELKGELIFRHGLLMLFLTMPSGWIATSLIGAVISIFGLKLDGMDDALFVSLTCTTAGYLQWFVVLPWMYRKWRARRSERMVRHHRR